MEQERKAIKGFKGFDKDLKCRGFQYEVGKEYECEKAVACVKGFHFCENPFDIFNFYPPSDVNGMNRFCKVEGSGDFDLSEVKKVCCSKIKVVKEISLQDLFEEGIKLIKEDEKPSSADTEDYSAAKNTKRYSVASNTGDFSLAANKGEQSAVANTGYYSLAANMGDYSVAANTGYHSVAENNGKQSVAASSGYCSAAKSTGKYSSATNTGFSSTSVCEGVSSTSVSAGNFSSASVKGNESVAIVTGKDCKAKGSLGCWIVLTERDVWDGECYPIKEVKAFKVDGERIKPDTFYKLVNGEAVEA